MLVLGGAPVARIQGQAYQQRVRQGQDGGRDDCDAQQRTGRDQAYYQQEKYWGATPSKAKLSPLATATAR